MSTSLTRRKLVAGAAWAAPVVAASATIPSYAASVAADCTLAAHPAYNISGTDEGAKTVQSFAVPNNVYKLRFELVGGAGGTNNRMTPRRLRREGHRHHPRHPRFHRADYRRGRRYR